jgi:endo-1,4-beta-xylanase
MSMFKMSRRSLGGLLSFAVMLLLFTVETLNAQVVTNGGFESSSVGDITSTGTKGWVVQVADTATPKPMYQIVSDTVEQGSRALMVAIYNVTTGGNQWDIQLVADSIHVVPGIAYNYSIWAKSSKSGATVNFTMGNYSYSEYGRIGSAALGTSWQQYTMHFTVNDGQTWIRGPIHLDFAANKNDTIWIDNLQIWDPNAGKKPVIVEAESGQLGSHFKVLQDSTNSSITYVTTDTNWTSLTAPGDTSRMITYQVPFADSGSYNLFARVRVGPGGFNDDSFFYGNGFGQKNDTAASDWVFINGLASGGFTDSTAFVDGPGSAGNSIWKWVNLTKNTYSGAKGDTFVVSPDSLTRTFQIGSREDGLDIDKIAFGKTSLYFTVHDLDSVLAGSPTMQSTDTGTVYKGPALAAGQPKFLGCAYDPGQQPTFLNYWNQVTPENAGKFGSVATSADSSTWNWVGLDSSYNFAINNHLVFKDHNLIWGNQQPAWITAAGFDSAHQVAAIEQWIRMVGRRYPHMNMIDVVNEPLPGHAPPAYAPALGGAGATGWDWVIWAFQKAREYMPANTKLLLNDYNILNSSANTTALIKIINLLKTRGLIDGIGIQCHRFELENTDTNLIKTNLNQLAATGIPIYISEFDLGNIGDTGTPNDATQLQLYQKYFPLLWQYPDVKGITIWGYIQGQTWQTTSYLVRSDGTARPALLWLANYIKNTTLGVEQTASKLPSSFALDQNYPNPFNPTTVIRYQLSAVGHVTLKVYDVLGRVVETLVDGKQNAGYYNVTFNANKLASGVYFYELRTAHNSSFKKMLLLK